MFTYHFVLLRLFTKSSIGKVLKAISQNEQRVEALGYKVLHYKIIASIVAGVVVRLAVVYLLSHCVLLIRLYFQLK